MTAFAVTELSHMREYSFVEMRNSKIVSLEYLVA
jgi:hypothetical protein